MDRFNVFFPHITAFLLSVLYAGFSMIWVMIAALITFKLFNSGSTRKAYVLKMSSQTWEKIFFSVLSVLAGVFIIFFLVPWLFRNSLSGKPDNDWQSKAGGIKTAVIFGFGYGTDQNGCMTPGASNQFLYDLEQKQIKAEYLIMQEGVFVAALKDSVKLSEENVKLISMHPVIPGEDVNTYNAARFAIMQMEKAGQTNAVVYAHSLQVKRAIADLRKIAASNPAWKNYEFVSPDIPETPFPKHSAQWRTKNKVLYRAIELYYSRVRDAWY